MICSLIVATSRNFVIGKNNEIPWHLPKDMKRFQNLTKGHYIILGRKNYEAIYRRLGKPLPYRISLVLSHNQKIELPDNPLIFSALNDAITHCQNSPHENISNEECFIIGGSEIYREALKLNKINKIYLTILHKEIEGDVFFPSFLLDEHDTLCIKDIPSIKWKLLSKEQHSQNNIDYTDFVYVKNALP